MCVTRYNRYSCLQINVYPVYNYWKAISGFDRMHQKSGVDRELGRAHINTYTEYRNIHIYILWCTEVDTHNDTWREVVIENGCGLLVYSATYGPGPARVGSWGSALTQSLFLCPGKTSVHHVRPNHFLLWEHKQAKSSTLDCIVTHTSCVHHHVFATVHFQSEDKKKKKKKIPQGKSRSE